MAEFNTKYDFKQKVFHISKKTTAGVMKACSFCTGSGRVAGADKSKLACPRCNGGGGNWVHFPKWIVSEPMTIGKITIEAKCEYLTGDAIVFNNYGDQKENYTESYMCYETGIDSGSYYYFEKLFATKGDAQTECDRLNAKIEGLEDK